MKTKSFYGVLTNGKEFRIYQRYQDKLKFIFCCQGENVANNLNKIKSYKNLLEHLMDRRFFRDPANIFNPHAQRLDDLNNRLFRGLNQWIVLQKQKMTGMTRQVVHLNPNKNIFRL